MNQTEPTFHDDQIPAPTEVNPLLMFEQIVFIRNRLLRAREDLQRCNQRLAISIGISAVAVVATLAVAICAMLMVRAEAKKTQEAVASLRAVEQTLSGLTDVQAQEVMKRKMLREIRTRAAAVAADPEAGKHVD